MLQADNASLKVVILFWDETKPLNTVFALRADQTYLFALCAVGKTLRVLESETMS